MILVKLSNRQEEYYSGDSANEIGGYLLLEDCYGNTTARLPLREVEWWGVTANK